MTQRLAWYLVAVAAIVLLMVAYPRRRVPEVYDELAGRSSKWGQVREKHIELYPRCEACGSMNDLNVHHILPYAQFPELELDPGNLMTLCREHHFTIGHDPDGTGPLQPSWQKYNPNAIGDARRMLFSR